MGLLEMALAAVQKNVDTTVRTVASKKSIRQTKVIAYKTPSGTSFYLPDGMKGAALEKFKEDNAEKLTEFNNSDKQSIIL